MYHFKNLVILIAVVISLACVVKVHAVPNFNNGFADWNGQLSDGGSNVVAVDPAADPHFSLNGNIATISYSELSDPYWTFTLTQAMAADQLQGAGYRLNISFYMQLLLGDGGTFDGQNGHIVSATLGSNHLINTTDQAIRDRLFAGDIFTADITNFAGSSDLLAFTLGDLDWSATDYLRIGDFSFSQVAPLPTDPTNTAVPEPSTMLLLGAGLAGLAFYRNRVKA